MTRNYRKLVAALFGAVVLFCFAGFYGQQSPAPQEPAVSSVTSGARIREPVSHTKPSRADWERWKRARFGDREFETVQGSLNGCFERLMNAVANANPDPDVSDLGGCFGQTPLQLAGTMKDVLRLLEAGADVNAQDDYGRTALHVHAAPSNPSEDSIGIIDRLLGAGADPNILNDQGEAPWQIARLHSSKRGAHLHLAELSEKRGISIEQFLTDNPHFQELADGLLDGYLVEAKIQQILLHAAVKNTPETPIH